MQSELIVDRSALLERVTRTGARCIVIVAPAGYGKSRFARMLTASARQTAICDVSGVSSEGQFCKAMVSSLLANGLADKASLSGAVAALPDNSPTWIPLLQSAWEEAGASDAVIVEDAENVARSAPIVRLLAGLARNAHRRRLVICSRTVFDVPAFQRVPPTDIAHVGVSDLEFSQSEMKSLLEGYATPEQVERTIQISQGWPVAALSFARSAFSGTLDAELNRASASVQDSLGNYIISEALERLDHHTLELIGACARLGRATQHDLEALQTSADKIAAMSHHHPFIAIDARSVYVHPLAKKALLSFGRGRDALRNAACRIATKDPVKAARFLIHAGCPDEAAQILGEILPPFLMEHIRFDVADIIGALDADTLLRNPAAWVGTLLLRVHTISRQQSLAEAWAAWAGVVSQGAHVPLRVRFGVGQALVNFLVLTSKTDDAENVLSQLESYLSDGADYALYNASVRMWRSFSQIRAGRLVDLEMKDADLRRFFAESPEWRARCTAEFLARAAVMRMDRDLARRHFQTAIDQANAIASMGAQIMTLICGAFFAWLAGEDTLFARYVEELKAKRTPLTQPAVSYFIDCATNDLAAVLPATEIHYQRTFGAIIAASRADSDKARITFAEVALTAAMEDGSPLVLTIAWLCIAFADAGRRSEAFRNAERYASMIEGGAWVDAVGAIQHGLGALRPYALRFRAQKAHERAIVRLFAREIEIDGERFPLSLAESEVLIALACAGREIDAAALACTLLPDEDPLAGAAALRVRISRMRKRFSNFELIASSERGYRLSNNVSLDLPLVERVLSDLESGLPVDETEEALLRTFVAPRTEGIRLAMVDSEWCDILTHRADNARQRAFRALATAATMRGDADAARQSLERASIEEALD